MVEDKMFEAMTKQQKISKEIIKEMSWFLYYSDKSENDWYSSFPKNMILPRFIPRLPVYDNAKVLIVVELQNKEK